MFFSNAEVPLSASELLMKTKKYEVVCNRKEDKIKNNDNNGVAHEFSSTAHATYSEDNQSSQKRGR